jgi:hypothetical protein
VLWRAFAVEGGLFVRIDPVCINQSSDDEKNHQVRMMAQIYTYAERTYAWLGRAGDSSDIVMDSITYLIDHSVRQREFDVSVLDEFLEKQNWTVDGYYHALKCFLNLDYWNRLWIVQEYSLSQEPSILCGKRWLPSSCCALFRSMLSREDVLPDEVSNSLASEIFSSREDMRDFLSKPRELLPLYRLIELFGRQQCADPRDHVYALLGMAKEVAHGRSFPIQYDASPVTLIADLVTFYEGEYHLDATRALLRIFDGHPVACGTIALSDICCHESLVDDIKCWLPLVWVGEVCATERWADDYRGHRRRMERSNQMAVPWLHLTGEHAIRGDHVVGIQGSFLGLTCRPHISTNTGAEMLVVGLALFLTNDEIAAQIRERYREGLQRKYLNLLGRTVQLNNIIRENDFKPERKDAKELSMALVEGLLIAAAEYQVAGTVEHRLEDWRYVLRNLGNPLNDDDFVVRQYVEDSMSQSTGIDVICIYEC